MKESLNVVLFSALKTFINTVIIASVGWLLVSAFYAIVRPPPPKGAALAIALAKRSQTSAVDDVAAVAKHYLGIQEGDRVDGFVQNLVKSLRGEVSVKGWTARAVSADVYVVAFQWSTHSDGTEMGMYWEVDTANQFVRPIVPDDELAAKYGVRSKEAIAADDTATAEAIKQAYPNAAMTYGDHVLVVQANEKATVDAARLARRIHGELGSAFANRKDTYLKVRVLKGNDTGEYAARY